MMSFPVRPFTESVSDLYSDFCIKADKIKGYLTALAVVPCPFIAGAANNQLEDENVHGLTLMKNDVLYAPDYLINAGGVMNCYAEVHDISSEKVMEMAGDIYNTTMKIFELSSSQEIPTYLAANRMAEERLKKEAEKNAK